MAIKARDEEVLKLATDAGASLISEQEKSDAAEVAQLKRAQHLRRLSRAIDAGYTVTGVRMSSAKDAHENGVVVTFTEDEQKTLVDAIRNILKARG